MGLRQLEYFVAVIHDLSFSGAAGRLYVSQPTVSTRIKALEQALGVALFERSSRAVAVRPAVADILPLARGLLADARRLREHAQLTARRLSDRLRIGLLADEYTDPAGERLIGSMRQRHPRIAV